MNRPHMPVHPVESSEFAEFQWWKAVGIIFFLPEQIVTGRQSVRYPAEALYTAGLPLNALYLGKVYYIY